MIAWLILPEVSQRTPAEIDELYVILFFSLLSFPFICSHLINFRFSKNVPLRKFDKFVTDVQMRADEMHEKREAVA